MSAMHAYAPAGTVSYRMQLSKAAMGVGEKQGGLNKPRIKRVLLWAVDQGIVPYDRVYEAQSGRGDKERSSEEMRATLRLHLAAIINAMRATA